MSNITKQDVEILEALKERFVYVSDKKNYGLRERWKVMTQETGDLTGDCEDFALTLAFNLSGRSYVRMLWDGLIWKHKLWYCKAPSGVGHGMLRYKGHWVCNIFPTFSKTTANKKVFPFLLPLALLKYALSEVLNLFTK